MAGRQKKKRDFTQPAVDTFVDRELVSDEEKIDYLPGYRYRIWHNDLSEGFSSHKHQALEIIMCTAKMYTVIIEEETYKLHEGDILFIPPMAMHQIVAPDEDEGERFILLFDTSFYDYFNEKKEILDCFSTPRLSTINTSSHLYPIIYSSLSKIIGLYFANGKMHETEIYSELLKITCLMCKNAKTSSDDESLTHSSMYDKFVNVLSYIEANYAEDLNLETIADTAGFSKFHFARMFKQYTNTTFYDYLCSKRILVAKNLLLTNIPVTDVAFQTGFNNLTTFCRCFKKYVGCSPTQYRSSQASIPEENLSDENIQTIVKTSKNKKSKKENR